MFTAFALTLVFSCSFLKDDKEDTAFDESGLSETDSSDTSVTPPQESNCAFENPSTTFTGGLYYLWSVAAPEGGAYSFNFDGNFVTSQTGTVDWTKSSIDYSLSFAKGYTTLSESVSGTFAFNPSGDYTLDTITETFFLDGSSREQILSTVKDGCAWRIINSDPDGVNQMTTDYTLVSADRIEYHALAEPAESGETYESYGNMTSDWTNSWTFEVTNASTKVEIDRDGTCALDHTGQMVCDMVQRMDSGYSDDHHGTWYPDGGWEDVWASHSPTLDPDPWSWGERMGDYWGSGSALWYIDLGKGLIVYCEGSWDTDGIGTWSCDDGAAGVYP